MIEPVSQRTIARHVPVGTVADVCEFVDELDRGAAGELVVAAEDASGAVFIEDGRICWAAAHGLARRLTELLMAGAGVDAATMEALFRRCKAERSPLGEYLVGQGIVSAGDLRAALAQHTVESLVRLAGPGRRGAWYPRPRGGYSARFTFGTAEVLSRAGAATHETAARLAGEEMAACFNDDDWAAAFVRTASRAVPEPVALWGNAPADAMTLARAARWAVSALDVVDAFDAHDAMVAVSLPRGAFGPVREVLVAFRHEGLVIAGETGAHCPARILNRRSRMRRARG